MSEIKPRGIFSGRVIRRGQAPERAAPWSNFVTDEGTQLLARLLAGTAQGGGWEIGLLGMGEPFLDDTMTQRDWDEPSGLDSRVPWNPEVIGTRLTSERQPARLEFVRECVINGVFVTRKNGELFSVGDRGFSEPFYPGDVFELSYAVDFASTGESRG